MYREDIPFSDIKYLKYFVSLANNVHFDILGSYLFSARISKTILGFKRSFMEKIAIKTSSI